MNIKKFVRSREHEKRRETSLFLLQNFDESCLKVTRHQSGEHEDSNDYHNGIIIIIPQLYGCVSSDKLDIFSKKYLNVCCGAYLMSLKSLLK